MSGCEPRTDYRARLCRMCGGTKARGHAKNHSQKAAANKAMLVMKEKLTKVSNQDGGTSEASRSSIAMIPSHAAVLVGHFRQLLLPHQHGLNSRGLLAVVLRVAPCLSAATHAAQPGSIVRLGRTSGHRHESASAPCGAWRCRRRRARRGACHIAERSGGRRCGRRTGNVGVVGHTRRAAPRGGRHVLITLISPQDVRRLARHDASQARFRAREVTAPLVMSTGAWTASRATVSASPTGAPTSRGDNGVPELGGRRPRIWWRRVPSRESFSSQRFPYAAQWCWTRTTSRLVGGRHD